MGSLREKMRAIASLGREAIFETVWPTRCAVCDVPGKVLCERCARSLHPVDWWRACRRCGSPYGLVQCDACNPVALARLGRERLPFDACASAVLFDDAAGRVARVFKDLGERRLADDMAQMMQRVLPPLWPVEAVCFVPAARAAFRKRGFDHAELIALSLAARVGRPCMPLLARPATRDQRKLSARGRVANLSVGFDVLPGAPDAAAGARLLLVDDVYTTGATLCAATDALRAAGAAQVRCLTFARV